MLTKKIFKNLKTGNYRVEYREHCDCRFDWRLEKDELVCDIVSNDGDCWIDNVLIMDDLAGQRDDTLSVDNSGSIAFYDTHFGLTPLLRKASIDAEQEIVKAIKNNYAYERLTDGIYSPDANNDLHDRRKREALVKWLSDNDHLRSYVYYPRDFANEYVCGLLVLPGYYRKKDLLWVPAHWYSKTADEWVEMYLQKDTDGTRYGIGFELINEIFEIDYCWYNHHADMMESHDSVRYFFVDLQGANNFLDMREPGGINCYELNKITVDYDGMIAETDYIAIKYGPEVVR
jgi:hypothetical protein